MNSKSIPDHLLQTRDGAMKAIAPIRPADADTVADEHFLFRAQRTEAGRDLPEYYLVYFLLVDLLGFRDLGQWEKVAYSIPIDLDGRAYLIEYRKMGLGVFVHDTSSEEEQARRIVTLIKKGVKKAEPFFEWLAESAVAESRLNVVNRSQSLFRRYQYLQGLYEQKSAEVVSAEQEPIKKFGKHPRVRATTYRVYAHEFRQEARWLALSTIEAFFSWSEHVFIHIALLQGTISTGHEVAELAKAEWQDKFKHALSIADPASKQFYDELIVIRQQLRNFIAHGSFGKRGEAFTFHSGTGAVPVLLPHRAGRHRYSLVGDAPFEEGAVIALLNRFVAHLWSNDREPAKELIQETDLPIILTMLKDGRYAKAMESVEDMHEFIEHMFHSIDQAANMDW